MNIIRVLNSTTKQLLQTKLFPNLTSETLQPATGLTPGGNLFQITVRNKIRDYFPRPCEVKRIRKHGLEKRMSTPAGRRVLMNRILKGRHVLSH